MRRLKIKEKKQLNAIIGKNSLIASDDPASRKAFLKELEVLDACSGLDLKGPTDDFVPKLKTLLEDKGASYLDKFIRNFLVMYGEKLSSGDRKFLENIISVERRNSAGDDSIRPKPDIKLPDKNIIIDFDLDDMMADFKKELKRETGPFAFSLQAPDGHVGMNYYAERFFKEFHKKRGRKIEQGLVKLWQTRFWSEDAKQPDYLLERLREELGCPVQEWLKNNPRHDLMVFARNEPSSGISPEQMENIAETCWGVVMEKYAGLLEKNYQCFLVIWCNINIPPVKIKARRFFVLKSPEKFSEKQLKRHWTFRLKQMNLDELKISRVVSYLKNCNGDITATYNEMCSVLKKLKGFPLYEY